jgi:hypothetical protein
MSFGRYIQTIANTPPHTQGLTNWELIHIGREMGFLAVRRWE